MSYYNSECGNMKQGGNKPYTPIFTSAEERRIVELVTERVLNTIYDQIKGYETKAWEVYENSLAKDGTKNAYLGVRAAAISDVNSAIGETILKLRKNL